jgi:hypothetical protein
VVESWKAPGHGERTEAMAEAERTADEVFMNLLMRFTREGRKVNEVPRGYYAPKQFANEIEAKNARVSKKALEAAMQRLFKAGRIKVETTRRYGRDEHTLVAA